MPCRFSAQFFRLRQPLHNGVRDRVFGLVEQLDASGIDATSVSLANFIVDIEAGPYAREYFAWNFNSGMAAIDGVLSHVLGRDDVLITSRNIYGGAWQLINDWYAKQGNLEIAVETFDGYDVKAFGECLSRVQQQYADRFRDGRRAYVYLESPCNPHGYVLDVAGICKLAHQCFFEGG